jgi:hypothetical protein
MEKGIVRQYIVGFGAGALGATTPLTGFQVPLGVYRMEVFAQGAGNISISVDQASLYYQSFNAAVEPSVMGVLSPDKNGVISFTATCNVNTATSESGVIILTPLTLV